MCMWHLVIIVFTAKSNMLVEAVKVEDGLVNVLQVRIN